MSPETTPIACIASAFVPKLSAHESLLLSAPEDAETGAMETGS